MVGWRGDRGRAEKLGWVSELEGSSEEGPCSRLSSGLLRVKGGRLPRADDRPASFEELRREAGLSQRDVGLRRPPFTLP